MWDKDRIKLDSSDMLAKVASLSGQLREGFDLAEQAWLPLAAAEPSALIVAGMGGSAIGGEILRSYLLHQIQVPVVVCRNYRLPRFVNKNSLVVISSYSGNTEEALSCFDDAIGKKAKLACIGSDGELLSRAHSHSVPVVTMPSGLPPRAALGYSFSALLALAWCSGVCEPRKHDLAECIDELESLSDVYSVAGSGDNQALRIAENLVDTVPLIYCSDELAGVGLRWKNQFCENSKKLAFVSFLPEMSHNDIMGWEVKADGLKAGVLFLRMHHDHPRVCSTFSFLKELVSDRARFCGEFWGSGPSLLSEMFSLILLGDYASVYLALIRGLDPTPIVTIDRLKSWLKNSQVRP